MPKRAMPKTVQTTAQLYSFHMLASNAQNSPSQASKTENFQMFKLGWWPNVCKRDVITLALRFRQTPHLYSMGHARSYDPSSNTT